MKTLESERKRYAKWRRKYPKQALLSRIRQDSGRRGIFFNLKLTDIPDAPEFCPVFPWIKLAYNVGKGRKANSISLDRLDVSKGYVKGNVRIISWRANTLRKNGTLREFKALAKDAVLVLKSS